MLACSEIENVERIVAQLQEAKKEADRTAGEAATAVAAAQDAAERVTALAADLEHAKAEADSFALIAELEAAKEDADNAAAYWSNPADTEDYRVHCDNDTHNLLQPPNSDNSNDNVKPLEGPPMTFSKQNTLSVPPQVEPALVPKKRFDAPKLNMEPPLPPHKPPVTFKTPAPDAECGGGAGCYLVFEKQNQGTLTATWSRKSPTFSLLSLTTIFLKWD